LEVGNAVHEQAANAVGAFVDRDLVSGFVELGSAAETGGSAADDGDLLAGATLGRLGLYPPLVEGMLDDRDFDVLDRDRLLVDAEHAGFLARRRADATGELREVVGLEQLQQRLVPPVAVDQVIPLGNDVAQRAARSEEHTSELQS